MALYDSRADEGDFRYGRQIIDAGQAEVATPARDRGSSCRAENPSDCRASPLGSTALGGGSPSRGKRRPMVAGDEIMVLHIAPAHRWLHRTDELLRARPPA